MLIYVKQTQFVWVIFAFFCTCGHHKSNGWTPPTVQFWSEAVDRFFGNLQPPNTHRVLPMGLKSKGHMGCGRMPLQDFRFCGTF